MAQLILKLDDNLHKALKVLAAQRKTNMKAIIVKLIEKEIGT